MKRIEIALLVGILLTILLNSFTSFAKDCQDVRQEVVRLHILANSDSEEDQSLKLAVRDEILLQTADLFSNATSKEQLEQKVNARLREIENIAQAEIKRQGYDYTAKAELVNMFFETRTYGETTLPAGRYDAVRVRIGEAKGKNWWCVMFPPMCIPAASEKLPLEQQIELLGQQPKFVPKLAVLEFVESISHNTGDEVVGAK